MLALMLTAATPAAAGPSPDQQAVGLPDKQAPAGKISPDSQRPTDIHDIRPPRQVGFNPAIFYWSGAGLLAALALAAVVFFIRRRRKKRAGRAREVTAAIYETPAETARRKLADLEAGSPAEPAAFYFRLTGIFREFLKGRFGLGAPEMTTEELVPKLPALDLDREVKERAREFLHFADAVKFARQQCDESQRAGHLSFVREMVSRTSESNPADKQEENP